MKFALDGIKAGLSEEPNLAIEISVGVLVFFTAALFQVPFLEWAILILVVFAVISLELVNTSIESLLDVVSPDKDPRVKKAKDTSAAALLAISVAALFIGILIFLPKLIPFVLQLLGK